MSSPSSSVSYSQIIAPPKGAGGPTTPRRGPPKFKQRMTRQFKSKPPKKGIKGLPDFTVVCPWEAFSHLELHELAQYEII
ncbi:hypothetical protein CRUP_022254 [Coryphaenoides rupestris]|nr:hypothetical protein CRUP_022254 [Coryphaenoides rupestris]